MTEETPPAVAADTGGTTPPAGTSSSPNAQGQSGTSSTTQDPITGAPKGEPKDGQNPASPAIYKIPDAYKDKPWASKIKSEDDLYKQIDNLNSAVGKKMVVPDLSKATDSEREEFYAQTRPESQDAYQFGEGTEPAIKEGMAKSLLKNGVSAVQANAIIKDYQDAEKAILALQYSPDGMKAEMVKQFGEQWEGITKNTTNALKGMLTAQDYAQMNKLPNAYIGLIYRIAGQVVSKYAVKEGDAHVNADTGQATGTDINEVRARLRADLTKLTAKPHTADQKQALIDKLTATYTNAKAS